MTTSEVLLSVQCKMKATGVNAQSVLSLGAVGALQLGPGVIGPETASNH